MTKNEAYDALGDLVTDAHERTSSGDPRVADGARKEMALLEIIAYLVNVAPADEPAPASPEATTADPTK